MTRYLCFIILFFTGSAIDAQTLVRKASMGIIGKTAHEGFAVDSVIANSTATTFNIKKHDVIISLNGQETKTQEAYNALASQLRAGDKVEIQFTRNGKKIKAKTNAVMRPIETSELADINYDWVRFRKGYLRTITRKPKGKTNVPCILLIPGYGCGSIENYTKSYNGKLINEWLKNGYAVVTIEKSGMGDSYDCAPCAEVDLATDIESFNAGYQYMENLPFVNRENLFIWGHSMGGVIAPEIAKLHHPKGVMVFGTVFRPWSEFLLEMHRVQKPLLDGLSYEETETFVRLIQKVYYEFFVLKKTRDELYANPEYKNIVSSELEHKSGSNNMWGRHWRFWQQLDSLNLASSWRLSNCPVLVINGGADYEQCAPIEPILIEQTVNAAHPGTATRVQIEDLDHFMMKSNNFKEAVENFKSQGYAKGNFNTRISDETVRWLNSIKDKS
ncbi:MAG: alpha/beta fold hydrolase [Bacteroidota bacterium]